jgi:hypothetical protein
MTARACGAVALAVLSLGSGLVTLVVAQGPADGPELKLGDFVADSTLVPETAAGRASAGDRGGVLRRVHRSQILVLFAPGIKEERITNLYVEWKLREIQKIQREPFLNFRLVETTGSTPALRSALAAREVAALRDPLIASTPPAPAASVPPLWETIGELRRVEGVVSATPNVLLGETTLPPPARASGLDNKDKSYIWGSWLDWRPTTSDELKNDGNYGQKLMNFPAAWNFNGYIRRQLAPPWGTGRRDPVGVAILDLGFSPHENLLYVPFRPQLVPRNHGNHVAGIIGATWGVPTGVNGCTPFVKMTACMVRDVRGNLSDIPSVYTALSQTLAEATDLIDRADGLRVINISLGYNWFANERVNPNNNGKIKDLVRAQGIMAKGVARFAARKRIFICSAAGNDSINDADGDPGFRFVQAQYSSPFNWAAQNDEPDDPRAKNIIVVESVGRHAELISPFSNVGGCLSAPGERILGPVARTQPFERVEVAPVSHNTYAAYSGTSFATPHITGLIALMYAYNPALTIDEVLEILSIKDCNRPATTRPAPTPNAFEVMVCCHEDSLKHLADLNEDGRVDMADFKRFKEDLDFVRAGTASESRDLNGDGVKSPRAAEENVFPRADLNGSGRLSTTRADRRRIRRRFEGGWREQDMSDLDVIVAVWEDAHTPARKLPDLLGP